MSDESDKRDKVTGRFLGGNRFWEARASCGPNPKFANPDDLWKACCEYFVWNENNPLWEDKIHTYEGKADHEPLAKMRAMSIFGVCQFIGIASDTWYDWKKTRPDLSDVIARTEEVLKRQKFEGASAGLLQANIISRDLGLADKMQSQMLGKDGQPTDPTDLGITGLMAAALRKVEEQDG